jgi:hypothetical protein
MTPDKRATLLKAFCWTLAAALLVGGYITSDVWLAALLGAR